MDWEYESQDLKVAYLKLRENFQQFTHRSAIYCGLLSGGSSYKIRIYVYNTNIHGLPSTAQLGNLILKSTIFQGGGGINNQVNEYTYT